VKIDEEDYLAHYGTPRHSGRYPWGSGEPENTRNKHFLDYVRELEKQGESQKDIAKGLGMSTTELRDRKSRATTQERQSKVTQAWRLKEKGMSTNAIAKQMGIPEATARNLLRPGEIDKEDQITSTARALKERVDEIGMVQVGKGVENYLGVSNTRLSSSLTALKDEGYEVHTISVPQVGVGKDVKVKVLAVPGTTQKDVWQNQDKIGLFNTYSDDGGRSYTKTSPPITVNPNRLKVLHADEGGADADGVIYVRPGVKDLNLGNSNYAQVRVKVGKDRYLKGMAIYKEDLPEGVDLVFNTSKKNTGNKLDALKPIQPDPDLPFGSIVRQIVDKPGSPDAKPISAMNIVNDEEDWAKWSRTLSSQFLSKQRPQLVQEQLDMTLERRNSEFDEIKSLTNPTVRKKLLIQFADSSDAASVHLKAAALPGQSVKVIMPVATLRETHVYAPGYQNGDRVVLIRHPHGGTFEIPELIVDNRHADSKKFLGENAKTAIGIHPKVAVQLSGADFDGDTVLVVPNRGGKILTSPPLEALKNFDARALYPGYPGMPKMKNTQKEMGSISNLITDMTIKGAPHDEIARAVKHSMVVIDAENHNLDHKRSFNDNNIKELKAKYQREPGVKGSKGGASTLISRAKSELRVPQREERKQSQGGPIDPVTGERVYTPTNRKHWKTGAPLTTVTTKLAEAKDARTLSSGTIIEDKYADYSNELKRMANQARLMSVHTPPSVWNPSAKKTYKNEVASLEAKLDAAKKNKPLERQAQLYANVTIKMKKDYNPSLRDDKATLKKVEQQAIKEARRRTGAAKSRIRITQAEWDAIQAGAISDTKLDEILTNADMDLVRQLATPKTAVMMTPTMTNRAQSMLSSGATRAEVASALGVSVSTLDKSMSSE